MMKKQRRKSGQFAKGSTPSNKGKVKVCGCPDCKDRRADPIGWRYMNHAGWWPHKQCGKIFMYINKRNK
jgi:hypothetical protein